jgi:hypothetical protein
MFEAMVPDFERVFGRSSRELLVIRSHLPGFYGRCGQHQKARDVARQLVPDLERVFGAQSAPTLQMRQNRAYAEEHIAEADLDDLLARSHDGLLRRQVTAEDCERARIAVGRHAQTASYRSRLKITFPDGAGSVEWRFEHVRPDKLHVRQSAGADHDEWIVIGQDRYQHAGLWFKPEGASNARIDELLTTDKYGELLDRATPTDASEPAGSTGARYLILGVEAVPAAFIAFFAAAGPLSGVHGRTDIWLDAESNSLARADVSLTAQSSGGALQVEAAQAYTDYGAEIEIRAPQAQIRSPR